MIFPELELPTVVQHCDLKAFRICSQLPSLVPRPCTSAVLVLCARGVTLAGACAKKRWAWDPDINAMQLKADGPFVQTHIVEPVTSLCLEAGRPFFAFHLSRLDFRPRKSEGGGGGVAGLTDFTCALTTSEFLTSPTLCMLSLRQAESCSL